MQKAVCAAPGDKQGERGRSGGSRWNCLEEELAADFEAPFSELAFATAVTKWLLDESANEERLKAALLYAAWALKTPAGRERNQDGVLFKAPAKLDYLHLLSTDTDNIAGYTVHRLHHIRRREGFALTDPGTDLVGALDEANYCIWCHEQGKDSCSKGLKEKPKAPGEAASFKKSQLGAASRGMSAGRAHFRVSQAQDSRGGRRRPGDDCGGQSHVRRYGSPDLQRLHEILHLPETGAGRYPPG